MPNNATPAPATTRVHTVYATGTGEPILTTTDYAAARAALDDQPLTDPDAQPWRPAYIGSYDAPVDTATQHRMVQRGLRAMERHVMSTPIGSDIAPLPRDAWWASMLASADRVVNAPDATGEQRADALTLMRDLTDYADAPAD